jgi:predicted dehydrogenase/threonine dehydrogenase-like Zn-dependent dehydrogenase
MLVEFGRASLLDKARQQPDKVAMMLEKMRTDGLSATIEAVTAKLDQPIALGYCNVGTVLAMGSGVVDFNVGDRVASNGPHAEVVRVPANLCARVPEGVPDEVAVYTVAGAIALQGVRLIAPTLGETIVVTGLGLVGLLAIQILRANGCRVVGIDLDPIRLGMARGLGAATIDAAGEDPVAVAMALTAGRGVDAVLIAASTDSSRPISDAAKMSRQRGRVVLVGVTGLELSRADFYAKEISFQVSCSYGPGRYDPQYEDHGHDYPIGFVRWTEQRNLGAVLDLMVSGSLRAEPLITHRFPIARAADAYEVLIKDRGALGILLTYEAVGTSDQDIRAQTVPVQAGKRVAGKRAVCSFIGAGNYASRILLPAFVKAGARLHTVVTSGSVQGVHAARKFGFQQVSTDLDAVFADHDTAAVVIATRHDSHADLVVRALAAGKHVFVEKPLALTREQLAGVRRQVESAGPSRPLLTVGFNRRFAPLVRRLHELIAAAREPRAFIYTVNAGQVAAEHWTQDRSAGGGRIIGEACHFIDLLRCLAGAAITDVRVHALGRFRSGQPSDSASISLAFANGDIGTMHYLATGHRAFPKERIEVFCGGGVLQLDNFRRLNSFGWPGFSGKRLFAQDKGQTALVAAFVAAISGGGPEPIPLDEIFEVSDVTLGCAEALEQSGGSG